MKRAIALWLAAMLVAVQPCYAVVMVGFGQSAPSGISDDFSSNSGLWTALTNQGMYISGGVANGGMGTDTSYAEHILYHETTTGTDDHYVELSTIDARSGVVLRCNGTTGYIVRLTSYGETSYAKLYSFNGASVTDMDKYFSHLTELSGSTYYKIKITVSGSTFHLYVDVNGDGDYLDTSEDWGTVTDTTYSLGQYVGVYFIEYSGNATADNFSAGAL